MNNPILLEQRGSALWVTINREERRNALNTAVLSGIAEAVRQADSDPMIRCLVLTGAGEKAFCAGADLADGQDTFTTGTDETTTDFGQLARLCHSFSKPIIARINGHCVAGGVSLLGLSDLAISTDKAIFALPEVRVGVFPMQVLAFLKERIAPVHFNELAYLGERISASRAETIGLINRVVPPEELNDAILRITESIGKGSPAAIKRGRYAAKAMETMSFEQALAFAETQITVSSRTSDAAEGIAAFNEKRRPAWDETPEKVKETVS